MASNKAQRRVSQDVSPTSKAASKNNVAKMNRASRQPVYPSSYRWTELDQAVCLDSCTSD